MNIPIHLYLSYVHTLNTYTGIGEEPIVESDETGVDSGRHTSDYVTCKGKQVVTKNCYV